VVHVGVICDCCEAGDIRGVRYHCVVCPDFDLCEACEKLQVHSDHPFLKVLHPQQMPATISCTLKGEREKKEEAEEKAAIFKAQLVKETDLVGPFSPGQQVAKTWTFVNSGKDTWTKNQFKFEYVNGDMFHFIVTQDKEEVKAGDTLEIEVRFTVPQVSKAIKICEFMSLKNFAKENNGALFGPKVWCEVDVQMEERSSLEDSVEPEIVN